MNIKQYTCLGAALTASALMAQAQNITFETEDFKSLGVYDTWEQSPFRTGALEGNVKVLNNHLSDDSNPSAKILGIQRSRFGSNTFGARIDLNEPFELGKTLQYVHVLMHKPIDGRVMLIGLGKKDGRTDQTEDIEQFWSYPVNDVAYGEWVDAVFPIKGNGNIKINSLVLVPHCEAPHTLDADFAVYIDDIKINTSSRPSIGGALYPVNFPLTTPQRSDRHTESVSFSSPSGGNQTLKVPTPLMAYSKVFDKPFLAKAGEEVTSTFGYKAYWMHGYVYLDKNNDGDFSTGVLENCALDPSKDLVAFSLYSNGNDSYGYASDGTYISSSNNGFNGKWNPPSYTLPADLAPGIYRMRYKIDWNNIEPGGDIESFVNNGGVCVDVLLNIHEDNVTVNQDNRNGQILLASTGEAIDNNTIPFGESLKIQMHPSNGFAYNGIRVRHGYNLQADSLVKENPQYRDDYFYNELFDQNDCFTIPAEYIDGNVLIEGLFVEKGTEIRNPAITYNIMVNGQLYKTETFNVKTGSDYPKVTLETETSPEFYLISGYPEGKVGTEDETITLTVEQNTPFKISADNDNAYWYNMTISNDKNYLIADQSLSYINLGTSSATTPDLSNFDAQWAFVGDIFDGFKIINRGCGAGMILSSSTNTSTNTGGATYPIVREEPVPDGYNTCWIPTVSESISGANGFYLHQIGIPDNRMNKRDNRLAYWTGGADGGSTFIVTLVATTSGIDSIGANGEEAEAEYFNLQGIKMNPENLAPGIYVRRQGNKVDKVLVK